MGWQPKQQAASKLLGTLHTHVRMLRLAPAQRSDAAGGQLGRQSTGNGQLLLGDLASPTGTGAGRSAAEQLGMGADTGGAGQMQLQHVQGLVGQEMPKGLLCEGWEQDIAWSAGGQHGKAGAGVRQKLLWDLNDPHMVFTSEGTAGLQDVAAVIHPAPPAPPAADKRSKNTLQDSLPELAHLNISQDAGQGAGRGDRVFAPVKHSRPLLQLTGLPIFPGVGPGEEWHRPRAIFYPFALNPAKRPSQVHRGEDGEEQYQVSWTVYSTSKWLWAALQQHTQQQPGRSMQAGGCCSMVIGIFLSSQVTRCSYLFMDFVGTASGCRTTLCPALLHHVCS
jgi:hypothetical protein